MPALTVRPATIRDRDAVLGLIGAMGGHDAASADPTAASQLGAALRRPEVRALVAEHGGRVVGYGEVQARPAPMTAAREAWVATLAVDPEARRVGVGAALVEALEHEARLLGCDALVLESGTWRDTSHAFWGAQGFEEHTPARRYRRALGEPGEAALPERFLAAAARATAAVDAALAAHADPDDVATGADGAPTSSADRAAEQAAIAALEPLGLPIVSEEAGVVGGPVEPQGRWISLDPLDGTRNYRSGCPPYACSVGLVEDGRAVAGFVHDLSSGRRWWAARGSGAWVDGRPARVRRGRVVGVLSVRTGVRFTSPALPGAERLRMSGSTAVDLCRVADGSYSAFWASRWPVLHPHDLAAGLAILHEAGGVVLTPGGIGPPRLDPDPAATLALVVAADRSDAQALLAHEPDAALDEA